MARADRRGRDLGPEGAAAAGVTLAATVLHVENAIASSEGAERRVAQAEMAKRIREHIACPSLTALRDAAWDDADAE